LAFEDRFPREPPIARIEHERVRTGDVEERSEDRPDAPPTGVEGHRGIYRLAFKAMPVPGFPDPIQIGAASLSQTCGPIWAQQTHIAQQPGWRPRFTKRMEEVEVGGGDWLTVCQLAVTIPTDLTRALSLWRSQALAAFGIVAVLLDERIAQKELLEDLLILDNAANEAIAVVDHVTRLRTFQAANRMVQAHRAALSALGSFDLTDERAPLAASRWYLRAARLGPTADAVLFLWIALEALSKPPFGAKLTSTERSRTDVGWVERALDEAGLSPSDVEPSVGRLAGLRAEIVHGGVEQPALLFDGYYALEQLVRLLLRKRLELGVGWPLAPDESNLREPLKSFAKLLHKSPVTEWT
jgi:hypothetical protein